MNIKQVKNLELDQDYTYCYPYGHDRDVQLKCLKGKYSGLIFDITNSVFIDKKYDGGELEKSFKFDYKIIQMWKNVEKSQFDGQSIFLKTEDQEYISSMVYHFIDEFMKNDKTRKIDNFKKIA